MINNFGVLVYAAYNQKLMPWILIMLHYSIHCAGEGSSAFQFITAATDTAGGGYHRDISWALGELIVTS